MFDVHLFFHPFPFKIRRSMFDLPAMPLGGLGRMSWCLGPVTMIMPPSFVMHGRRVFDVHFFSVPPGQKQLSAYGCKSPIAKLLLTY